MFSGESMLGKSSRTLLLWLISNTVSIFAAHYEVITPSIEQHYSERPDISKIEPKDHSQALGSLWRFEREGHLESIAEILELYPDRQLYFLARDGELLYDFAKIVLENEPAELARIHLLNVSRANMKDKNLLRYLAQEGISEGNLAQGMKVMFVDTGFAGTIPEHISSLFPERLRKQLQTHLLCSENPSHPSSRVFLEYFHSGAANLDPATLHSSIVEYEHMPRFTFRSHAFQVHLGKWSPVGLKTKSLDGQVDQQQAIKYMEDLKFYALSAKTWGGKIKWQARRSLWKNLRNLIDSNNKVGLEKECRELLKSSDNISKAIVRDFIEAIERNEPSKASLLPNPESLSLSPIRSTEQGTKKNLIAVHPQWAKILNNPVDEIPKLVNGTVTQVQKLRMIIDEIGNEEVKLAIVKSLFFLTDVSHYKDSEDTFNSIKSRPNWVKAIVKAFNEDIHRNPRIIELGLRSHEESIREQATISIAYYTGKDIAPLFERALTDDSGVVRQAAENSLFYRNTQDRNTFNFLLNLLSHPDSDIRAEIGELIFRLYFYSFAEYEETLPLLTYLQSDYARPLDEFLDLVDLKEAIELMPFQVSVNLNPIQLVPEDDARIPKKEFASGEVYQIGRLLWTQKIKKEYHEEATTYCQSVGGRLPTKEEIMLMIRAKGYKVPKAKLSLKKPLELEHGHYLYIWSSSPDPERKTNFFALKLNDICHGELLGNQDDHFSSAFGGINKYNFYCVAEPVFRTKQPKSLYGLRYNWTPLHTAAHRGNLDTVKNLVTNGARLEAKDPQGYTPLALAVIRGHIDIAKYLLRHGADLLEDSGDKSILALAQKHSGQKNGARILRMINRLTLWGIGFTHIIDQ